MTFWMAPLSTDVPGYCADILKQYKQKTILKGMNSFMRRSLYAQKKHHKRVMKKQYAMKYGDITNIRLLRDKLERDAEEYRDSYWYRKHPARNNGWEYWRQWYISGRRRIAKKYTDKRIRQKYRQMIHRYDPDDVTAPRGSDYEKEYDYAWTIW